MEEGSETLVLLEHLQPCTVFRLSGIFDTKRHHIHAVARRRRNYYYYYFLFFYFFKMLLVAPKYETMLLINLEAHFTMLLTKGCGLVIYIKKVS
jgi:hypothetical protein